MDEIKEKVKLHHWVQRAYDKLRKKYGESPNEEILLRFYTEEKYFFRNEERTKNLGMLLKLKERAEGMGEQIYSFGVTRASLIAYLLGVMDENPLPPHYYCPTCKKVEFINEKKLPWDMPSKPCTCGCEMQADGFDIPFEAYKTTIISPHVCSSEEFAKEIESITDGTVKIYPTDNLNTLKKLKDRVGAPTDEQIFESFNNDDFACVLYSFFGVPISFTRDFTEKAKPQNYYELLQVFGFANGKGVWYDNAEKLIDGGRCAFSDIPTFHEDVLIDVKNRIKENNKEEKRYAHHVAFNLHYGHFATDGISEQDATKLRELGFEDWFFDYIKNITFMYSKTHAVIYFKQVLTLMWYNRNFSDILQTLKTIVT